MGNEKDCWKGNTQRFGRYLVYGLTDRRGNIKYIGSSGTGLETPRHKFRDAQKDHGYQAKTPLGRWIRSRKTRYGIVVLERCRTREEAYTAEAKWIGDHKSFEMPILNVQKATAHRSGVLGVSWSGDSRRKPWRAYLRTNGKLRALGSFATVQDAKDAYEAAKEAQRQR